MADTVIAASLKLDDKQATQSVSSFRAELKKAQNEVISVSEKFGATSEQAIAAAKHAAELKEQIVESKKLVDAFHPEEKFKGFAQALTSVAGGFAAVEGAMGLLGVKSEDVQAQLLKVQSALALTEGLNRIGEITNSFKNLGSVLVNALGKGGAIGLAVAGVGALTAAFLGLFNNAKEASEAEKAVTETTKDYSKAAANAIQQVNAVKNAFELARTGVISKKAALKEYNETLGDSLGKTNDLTKAEKNLTDKADDYIKVTALKAQANALFAKSAQISADTLVAQKELEKEAKDIRENTASFLQKSVSNAEIQAKNNLEEKKKQAKEIENLGADLLKQADKIEKASGIISKVQQEVNKDAAEKAKKALEQAKKDFAEQVRLRAAHITGTVTVLSQGNAKSAEEIELENRLKATHNYVEKKKELLLVDASNEQQHTWELESQTREREAQAQAEFENRKTLANATTGLLSAVADLFGKQTAAGKALGIATATINTWIGVTEVLRSKSLLPEPLATIAKIANVATIIASGLSAVRNIVKVQVPGGGGGIAPSAGSISAQAPLTPQPQIQTTQLDQNTINKTNNATVRAFVLESDVSGNQERITRLNRAARLGN